MDLISIIVPIYKVEKYIHKCIDSIIDQTYKNLEIILVDDGSPDKCGYICEEYAKKDKRIKVIHKENGGLSDARNAGIKIAKGKYIGFVDSDDYIKNDMYEYLHNIITKNNADIAICGINLEYENNKEILSNKKNINKERNFNGNDAIKELLIGKIVQNYAWNKLYKKNLFDNIEYPKGRKMEDLGTTYKLFYKSQKVVIGEKNKYIYKLRNDSITGDADVKFYIDYYELEKERYYFIKERIPNMIENELAFIDTILKLYRINNKEIEIYIEKNEINKLYNELIKNNIFKIMIKAKFSLKIKIILFAINKNLYKNLKK